MRTLGRRRKTYLARRSATTATTILVLRQQAIIAGDTRARRSAPHLLPRALPKCRFPLRTDSFPHSRFAAPCRALRMPPHSSLSPARDATR